MKSFKIIIIALFIIIIILLAGCDFKLYNDPEVDEGAWREDFIAIMNIDGSDVELIQSQHQNYFAGARRPYFVKDLAGNSEEEVILLDFQDKIDIMSLDGENRRTIIDSLGGVQYFNQDRTKMILLHNGKVYLSSVDGSKVEKISLSSITRGYNPSFAKDEETILYNYIVRNDTTTTELGLVEYNIYTNNSQVILNTVVQEDLLFNPAYQYPSRINENVIVYRYDYNKFENEEVISSHDFREHDLVTNEIDILIEGYINLKYSNLNEFVTFERGNDRNIYLLNIETQSTISFETSLYDIEDASFSSDDRYLMLNETIYDTHLDSTFILEDSDFFGKYHNISKTSMNSDNTKIVGIVGFLHY